MAQLELKGINKKEEIKNVSGKGISFKKIRIPGEDCSNFIIQYEIINQGTGSRDSCPIYCITSPYQREVSQVNLFESILIPDNSILMVQVNSILKRTDTVISFIDYEIFIPPVESKQDKMVFISENDRQNAFRVALINLARFFNIPNWEYENNQVLYNKLKRVNNPVVKLLQEYFIAYDKWFKFYAKIKKIEAETNQRHDLTDAEGMELAELINNRERSLNTLQIKFDELQFEKFKKSHGLENVDGIIL